VGAEADDNGLLVSLEELTEFGHLVETFAVGEILKQLS
jgi:hypothetical protein